MSLLGSLTPTGKNLNKRLPPFFLNSPTPFDKGGRPDGSPGGHTLENYLFFLFQKRCVLRRLVPERTGNHRR